MKEQIEWRLIKIAENSPDCLKKGECFCGCSMPEKAYEDRGCEGWEEGGLTKPCYPDMMSEKEWGQICTISHELAENIRNLVTENDADKVTDEEKQSVNSFLSEIKNKE